jgi:hypothetical protein
MQTQGRSTIGAFALRYLGKPRNATFNKFGVPAEVRIDHLPITSIGR